MDTINHFKVPKETPGCGVEPEIVYTIANIRYCLIYVWLVNKQEFWFYPINQDGHYLDGYAWNRRRWVRGRINISSVKSYCC